MRKDNSSAVVLTMVVLGLTAAMPPARAQSVDQNQFYTNLVIPVYPYLYGGTVLYQDFAMGNYRFYLLELATKSRRELHNNFTAYRWPVGYGGSHAAWVAYPTEGGYIPVQPGGGARKTTEGASKAYRVELIDTATKVVRSVAGDTAYKEFLVMDDVSVVWSDYRHSSPTDSFPELYRYRLPNGGESRLTYTNAYKGHLSVYGGRVVWQDYRNAGTVTHNADIYMLDMGADGESAVCTDGAYQAQPSTHGSYIVWQDYRNAATDPKNADIYLYDIRSGTEMAVCTAPGYQAHPQVHGRLVVWQDYRNVTPGDTANADIYLYDIDSRTELPVTTRGGYQDAPSLFGYTILWYDYTDKSLYRAVVDPSGTSAVVVRRAEHVQSGFGGARRTLYDMRGRMMTSGSGAVHQRAPGVLADVNGRTHAAGMRAYSGR